ncbi:MAG: SAP domain-containing protein [Candidatus Hydrogenedentes bacterium]|nr:SAP domain-containing protein [Candidatus Hydrogenedentota bacterium]
MKRQAAAEFADRWRTDTGKYVFQTTMDKLTDMVERNAGGPSFPSLNYVTPVDTPVAPAEVDASRVKAFHVARFPTSACTSDQLKGILREYGASQTGNKEELATKFAALAANTYEKKRHELDEFFSAHRFVRVDSSPQNSTGFPILDGPQYLRNLVLAMYALRHLRGNAILESAHENTTYGIQELALALVFGKIFLTGGFVPVA